MQYTSHNEALLHKVGQFIYLIHYCTKRIARTLSWAWVWVAWSNYVRLSCPVPLCPFWCCHHSTFLSPVPCDHFPGDPVKYCACLLLAPLQKVVCCVFSWHVAFKENWTLCSFFRTTLHRRTLLSVVAIWQNFAKLQIVQERATVHFATHWASLWDLALKCNILCYPVDFRNIIFLSVSFWVCRCN